MIQQITDGSNTCFARKCSSVKAYHFDDMDKATDKIKETYGFRTSASPPVIKDLTAFETDLHELVASIEFRKAQNEFLDRLDSDVQNIKSCKKVIIPADKTSNFYHLSVDDYYKLITKNISAEYRKSPPGTADTINSHASDIANKLKLKDRMQKFQTSQAFVLLKDHKSNFSSKLPCRLINPAKSDIGRVSKFILENITEQLRTSLSLNQWKSTPDVIHWFKQNCVGKVQFLQYDIESFYPSITEPLLDRALEFAQQRIEIEQDDIDIIKHSRQSILFCPKGEAWQRKDSLFDVTMGAPDGAEVCELVGLYLLHKTSSFVPLERTGLYRDDGLILITDPNGPKMERIRKDLFNVFKEEGLKITVSPPSNHVNYLDVTLHDDQSFRPFRKEDKTTLYVHHQSNHPKTVINNIPKMISNRISSLSSNKEIFDLAKPHYEQALTISGYSTCNFKYDKDAHNRKTKPPRKRKILWFNPPYSATVKTNVGRKFLYLIEKHFPKSHRYHKLVNKNTVKVSYSCMKNMESIIKSHNKKLLNQFLKSEDAPGRQCNCRSKDTCPLNGNCLTESVVYSATITAENETSTYIGMTEGPFKTRYSNHKSSFRLPQYRNATKLSEAVWTLKDNATPYTIKWDIVKRGTPYKNGRKYCDLCTSEKVEIILRSKDPRLINSRNEIMAKCRHKRKFRL